MAPNLSQDAQRWEYMAVATDWRLDKWYELGGDTKWRPNAGGTIASLGTKGWELVNTLGNGNLYWFFRRPLP